MNGHRSLRPSTTRTRPSPADGRAKRSGAPIGVAVLAAVSTLLLAACGDDAEGSSDVADGELEVTMADFHYGDALPASVPAGTRIVVSNDSPTELHEFVAVRLADDDDRTPEEIVDGDLGAVFATPPATVILVPPDDGEPIIAVGDGTLQEPGRYLIVCAIPTGVDPDVYLQAAAEAGGGPPQVEGGPPHFVHGMFAELEVVP